MAFNAVAGYGQFPNGNFSPVVFSKAVLKKFRRASVVQDITNTAYAGEIANEGDSVRIIKEPDVIVTDYVRGQNVVPTELIDDAVTMTVDRAKKFAFAIDDIEAKQSHINWMDLASDKATYNLRNAYDLDILSYGVAQAQLTLGTTGTPITVVAANPTSGQWTPLSLMNRINTLFDEADIPWDERVIVGPPSFWEYLGDENSKFMPVNITGKSESPLVNGRIIEGDIRGFIPYKSNNLPYGGTGARDAAGYGTVLAMHKSALATATQIAKTEVLRSQNSFADVVRGLLLFGRFALRPEAIFRAYIRLA